MDWDDVSPETEKKITRWAVAAGVFTLISSIAIGIAGGLLVVSKDEDEDQKVYKGYDRVITTEGEEEKNESR